MLILGDCLEKLKDLEDNSVDSIVTDPPYGWRFMGKAWDGADIEKHANWAINKKGPKVMADGRLRNPRPLKAEAAGKYDQSIDGNLAFQIFTENWAIEAMRVLKPGGHAIVFCGPRTYHRMASGLEDAGFEIRDQLQWLFGSGFPKSHNIGNGIGTALKPANEPICLARKPLSESTVAKNVERWGTGGLNIDASRVEGIAPSTMQGQSSRQGEVYGKDQRDQKVFVGNPQGRWPANLILDEIAAQMLDEQSGNSGGGKPRRNSDSGSTAISTRSHNERQPNLSESLCTYGDSGGASRFFYCAKASKSERGIDNNHPTVKPLKLMEYLIKLVTPPNGTVLDPFMGSGSTCLAAKLLGFKFIGIEMNAEYLEIATKRIQNSKVG